jgi:oligoendopeptidase F
MENEQPFSTTCNSRKERHKHSVAWTPERWRKRGRLKTTWQRTVERERNDARWRSWDEARAVAANRKECKLSVTHLCTKKLGDETYFQ